MWENIVELFDPDNPSVRYMLCKNPLTEKQEREKRTVLIDMTVKEMEKLANRKKKIAFTCCLSMVYAIIAVGKMRFIFGNSFFGDSTSLSP